MALIRLYKTLLLNVEGASKNISSEVFVWCLIMNNESRPVNTALVKG